MLLLTWAILVSVACANPGTSRTPTPITPILDTTTHAPALGMTVEVASPSPDTRPAPTLSPLHGATTITFGDNLQTIILAIGDTFILDLGGSNNWQIQVGDERIIARVPDPVEESHARERYRAITAGQTYLQATGVPDCVVGTPGCSEPNRVFHLTIIVQ